FGKSVIVCFIVGSYQNHTALARLAVLFILSQARRLVCFGSKPTIILKMQCYLVITLHFFQAA
ncbi:MAG: hypothetical protein IJ881_02850, partial [Neisseriaceae bacterium]|nr:hypothetical protein [Neisseriaceae bacterium]